MGKEWKWDIQKNIMCIVMHVALASGKVPKEPSNEKDKRNLWFILGKRIYISFSMGLIQKSVCFYLLVI